LLCGLVALLGTAAAGRAGEPAREAWTGIDGVRDVWALYSGVTWSPFTTLQQDGWRLRLTGSRSAFRYVAAPYDPLINAGQSTLFQGAKDAVDLLVGWQASQGPWTWKLFGGLRWQNLQVAPLDPEAEGVGRRFGGVAALETWVNLGGWGWAAVDFSYATADRTHAHRVRLAARIGEPWSVGGEARMLGAVETATWRVGPFVRFDNGDFEVTLAGGFSRAAHGDQGGYGTAQMMRRF
jgi:hypothetical protein